MFASQYKNLATTFGLLSKNIRIPYPNKFQNITRANGSLVNLIANKNYFASKKPKIPDQKGQKQLKQQVKDQEQSQLLWKLNMALNIVGIGAGFYFPKEAVMFVLTSNSIFQVYESSKSIIELKEMLEKSANYTPEQLANGLIEGKQHFKKIVISTALFLAASIMMGMGVIYPSLEEYSLLGLNFWILFNLKFNSLSHGYYFVLLSLAAFQYLYFQKIFESNKQNLPFQRP